jgi:membrane protease subunit (stomatin/prohibitin family)
LTEQQQQFEAAVADILGMHAGQQQAGQLAEAVQEQQQLQEAEVRLLRLPQLGHVGAACSI